VRVDFVDSIPPLQGRREAMFTGLRNWYPVFGRNDGLAWNADRRERPAEIANAT